ncbi:Scytalone dehydratase-domain-containing protein [Neohortaea acidophila]|uniref:Scytalone dehydratase-domain-containing protein n=1 Tax=Neohortaea acidophila TaxID=245834 RepID=A0A6A6PHS6_9PEZI|nr:Scytalone dehydratase-domain-containing protein [Neohortaea acidophila]KAF2479588.1 Scytalone dehydratase-domain-containing protein [Neohortaea acidophila]
MGGKLRQARLGAAEALSSPGHHARHARPAGPLKERLSPDEFIAIHASPKVIGDPRVKTQHLVGVSRWSGVEADGSVRGSHQLRVAHQRYADEGLKEVVNKGHGYGVVHQSYAKVEGEWKITGNAPTVDWSEYDLFGTMNPDAKKD